MNSVTNDLDQNWKSIDWVLTDVDDTLTWQGRLPPETLVALKAFKDAGKRSRGCDGGLCWMVWSRALQLWPVDAVLGENGAFIMEKEKRLSDICALISRFARSQCQSQVKLKEQVLAILSDYPNSIQRVGSFSLTTVCVRWRSTSKSKTVKSRGNAIIEEIVSKIHALGAHATASSYSRVCLVWWAL